VSRSQAGNNIRSSDAPTSVTPRGETLRYVEYLRALAVVCVVWCHFVSAQLIHENRTWKPLELVERYVTDPLAIIQQFGFFGVAVFFLVSGFIVSHVAVDESAAQFAIRRVFRIFPMLIVTTLLVYPFLWIENAMHGISRAPVPSIPDSLFGMSLLNYPFRPSVTVIAVAWTLAVEVAFYGLMFLVHPLQRRNGALATWAMLAVVAYVVDRSTVHTGAIAALGGIFVFVPLVLLGRAIWLRWSSRISVGHFALLSIASWCVFVWAVDRRQPDSFDPGNSYGVSMGLAYGVFVVALLLEPTIRRRWYVTWVSERSYSIYLLHLYTGVLVLDALSGHAPYTLALVLALLATIVASEFTYRFVERPMRRFARGLSNGGLRRTVAPRLVRARFGSSSYTLTERT